MPSPLLSGLLAGLGGGLTTYGAKKREDELRALERQQQLEDINREILQNREGVMRNLQAQGARFGGTRPDGYEQIDFAGLGQPAFVPPDFTEAGRRQAIASGLTGVTPVGARSPLSSKVASLLSYDSGLADLFIPRQYSPSAYVSAAGGAARNKASEADRFVQAANGSLPDAIARAAAAGSDLNSIDLQAAVARFNRSRGSGLSLNMTGDSTSAQRPRAATGATPRPATGVPSGRRPVTFNP